MSESKTGRPPKYTEAQVLIGIDEVEQNGGTPTGETVKAIMCAQLGVPGGINAQSLDRQVQRLLAERERTRREQLVAALPAATKAAAREIGARVEGAVLDHMAEEHDQLRSAAGKKIVEMRDDLVCQRAQIRELLSQVEAQDSVIADLEGTRHSLEQRLAAATAEIASLKDVVSRLETEQDFRAQILGLVQETLAEHSPGAS